MSVGARDRSTGNGKEPPLTKDRNSRARSKSKKGAEQLADEDKKVEERVDAKTPPMDTSTPGALQQRDQATTSGSETLHAEEIAFVSPSQEIPLGTSPLAPCIH